MVRRMVPTDDVVETMPRSGNAGYFVAAGSVTLASVTTTDAEGGSLLLAKPRPVGLHRMIDGTITDPV